MGKHLRRLAKIKKNINEIHRIRKFYFNLPKRHVSFLNTTMEIMMTLSAIDQQRKLR